MFVPVNRNHTFFQIVEVFYKDSDAPVEVPWSPIDDNWEAAMREVTMLNARLVEGTQGTFELRNLSQGDGVIPRKKGYTLDVSQSNWGMPANVFLTSSPVIPPETADELVARTPSQVQEYLRAQQGVYERNKREIARRKAEKDTKSDSETWFLEHPFEELPGIDGYTRKEAQSMVERLKTHLTRYGVQGIPESEPATMPTVVPTQGTEYSDPEDEPFVYDDGQTVTDAMGHPHPLEGEERQQALYEQQRYQQRTFDTLGDESDEEHPF